MSFKFLIFMLVYRAAWLMGLPLVILYLFHKSRREPRYRQNISERFGLILSPFPQDIRPVWIHAASLGELRGITTIIHAFLAQGEHLLITTLTPAGRSAAEQTFSDAISNHRLCIRYVPLEIENCVTRLIKHFRPQCALMAEIDSWPVLLNTCKKSSISLGFINSQYPKKSFERDLRWLQIRSFFFTLYDIILCKSQLHATRFIQAGCKNVHIVGETRFDLPIPPNLVAQANQFTSNTGFSSQQRPIFCIASSVADEESLFIKTIQSVNSQRIQNQLPLPFWVIVPRSPQRFDSFYNHLSTTPAHTLGNAPCLSVVRRSELFDQQLNLRFPKQPFDTIDVLLGDSLGEMFFYLQMAHLVIVGASFVPLGSHNVIEPLALKKPVLVGPSIWGIEYPGIEAMRMGVLKQCMTLDELSLQLSNYTENNNEHTLTAEHCDDFYKTHKGSTQRHLAKLNTWLKLPLIG